MILSAFLLSSAINYLDRQTFVVLGPRICKDTRVFGLIISLISAAYAAAAPLAGMLIDRVGLNMGASLAVGLWSCAGIATGFTAGIPGLIACRTVLGAAEAGGIPSAGKAIHKYLKASERALGNALNQMGVSLGFVAAPPLAAWLTTAYGWRMAFVATGVLGLVWIPFWNLVARAAPAPAATQPTAAPVAPLWGDSRLWVFVAANALTMVGYSLWTTWITYYLQDEQHLDLLYAAAHYAWIPALAAMPAGLAGGWLSARLVAAGVAAPAARFQVCLIAATLSLGTLAIPYAHTPGWATAGIALSFSAVAAMSVNVYSLPLDIFGGARAGSAISALVASYGAMQFVVSPLFGWIIHTHGYSPLMVIAAFTPAAACAVLWRSGAVQ